jgi:hypothetical protein
MAVLHTRNMAAALHPEPLPASHAILKQHCQGHASTRLILEWILHRDWSLMAMFPFLIDMFLTPGGPLPVLRTGQVVDNDDSPSTLY